MKRVVIKCKNANKNWTLEEDEYLEDKWGRASIKLLMERLGRSQKSIEHRVSHLGLGGMYNNGECLLASNVAVMLGVSRSTVMQWIKDKGLKARKVRYGSQVRYKVLMDNLSQWLKDNPERWNSTNLEFMALGVEEDWLKEKRKQDLKMKAKRTPYSKEEDARILFLYKQNKTYSEIAEETGLSVHRVGGRIRAMRKNGVKIPYKNARTQEIGKAV